jgi:hypothetical protein
LTEKKPEIVISILSASYYYLKYFQSGRENEAVTSSGSSRGLMISITLNRQWHQEKCLRVNFTFCIMNQLKAARKVWHDLFAGDAGNN